MAGTNTVRAKRALIDKLAELADLQGVQVAYSWPGARAEREVVHGGRATFTHERMGFSPQNRQEQLEVTVWIAVSIPGGSVEDAEARAVQLGEIVENALAADPKFITQTIPGLEIAAVTGGELDSDFNDDGSAASLMYRIGFTSHLR